MTARRIGMCSVDVPTRLVAMQLMLAAVFMIAALARGLDHYVVGDGDAAGSAVQAPILVNSAPWWELALLPTIGETRARTIVSFRESVAPRGIEDAGGSAMRVAFREPADLMAVRGIGPITAVRVAPYIDCGPPAAVPPPSGAGPPEAADSPSPIG